MRISDWSSDVCSSDLVGGEQQRDERREGGADEPAEVGGQHGAAVAELASEAGVDGAGCLRVAEAEQREADQDEDVRAEGGAFRKQWRHAGDAEDGDQDGADAERGAAADAVGDVAGDQTRPSSEERSVGKESVRTCGSRWA